MPAQAPPSIKELLARAIADSKRLATAQVALTKAEVSQSGSKIGFGAGMGIVTLGLLFFFAMFLLISLALVLVQLGLPPWAGFLIITGVLLLGAVITALLARKSFNDVKPPSLAIAELEKTKAALSGALGSEPDPDVPPLTAG